MTDGKNRSIWYAVWEFFGYSEIVQFNTADQICNDPLDAAYIYGWYMYADRAQFIDPQGIIERDIANGIPYREYRLMGYLDAQANDWKSDADWERISRAGRLSSSLVEDKGIYLLPISRHASLHDECGRLIHEWYAKLHVPVLPIHASLSSIRE
jgi:hypothetical protein